MYIYIYTLLYIILHHIISYYIKLDHLAVYGRGEMNEAHEHTIWAGRRKMHRMRIYVCMYVYMECWIYYSGVIILYTRIYTWPTWMSHVWQFLAAIYGFVSTHTGAARDDWCWKVIDLGSNIYLYIMVTYNMFTSAYIHYITLHCIALHYSTLHNTALHYIRLQYSTLHYILTCLHTYKHTDTQIVMPNHVLLSISSSCQILFY